jgi:hypothetical protein
MVYSTQLVSEFCYARRLISPFYFEVAENSRGLLKNVYMPDYRCCRMLAEGC